MLSKGQPPSREGLEQLFGQRFENQSIEANEYFVDNNLMMRYLADHGAGLALLEGVRSKWGNVVVQGNRRGVFWKACAQMRDCISNCSNRHPQLRYPFDEL